MTTVSGRERQRRVGLSGVCAWAIPLKEPERGLLRAHPYFSPQAQRPQSLARYELSCLVLARPRTLSAARHTCRAISA